MKDKNCNCSALDSPGCRLNGFLCDYCKMVNRIKQNGIDPKSKLFWALMPFDYAAQDDNGIWHAFKEKPRSSITKLKPNHWYAPHIAYRISIKISYTGDWKDSLHFRGDYE